MLTKTLTALALVLTLGAIPASFQASAAPEWYCRFANTSDSVQCHR